MLQINLKDFLKTVAAAAIASNAGMNGAICGLFTGSPVITRDTVLADLAEADFQGYARSSAVVWGSVLRLPDGGACFVGDRKQFVANNTLDNAQVISGAFLVNNGNGSLLLAAGAFDNPIPIALPGDSVNFNPSLQFSFDTEYSELPGPNP